MTQREQFEKAAQLFLAASRLPPTEVDAFLRDQCGNDEALRQLVVELLQSRDEDRVFRSLARQLQPAHERLREELGPAATITMGGTAESGSMRGEEKAGDVIGRFRLLELIGEGGFGRVWVAEQREPVARRVALKVIKAGMDSRQVVARFEQERQALAVMDHPHIAKVFDAGTTETGRPFFVMELCKGDAIAAYCDKHSLSIPDRLQLFEQVCSAVQHAHTKGVIHRDIKPNNVLVSTQDGRPHAKVIDFGIAKAIEARLTEKTLFTEHRQLIGTPEYMSPEQAEGSLDIDTRTDVYSLGVVLYELLTGSTPFSSKELRSAAFGELQRIIREVDPPRPSTRLSQSSETLGSIAACRRVEAGRLGSLIRGELDWIVMKALEKDRARRYESASSLGADVRRFLSGEAVVAAPPSRAYRVRKFIRRHMRSVVTLFAVGLALLIGLIAFAWQANAASVARDRAVAAEAETKRRADELQKVSDFQAQMIGQVDPTAAGQRLENDVRERFDAALAKADTPAEERAALSAAFASAWARVNATDAALELIDSTILKPGLTAIDRQFADEPKINATLKAAIASRYLDLGLLDKAEEVSKVVIELRRKTLGEDDRSTMEVMLAECKTTILRGQSAKAEAVLRPLLEKIRAKLGPDDPLQSMAIEFIGESVNAQQRFAESEACFRESLAARRRVLGEDNEFTLQSLGNLSLALRGQGKLGEAEKIGLDLLERRRRVFGEDDPYVQNSYNNLGVIYVDQGRLQEAVDVFRRALEGRRRVLGETHHNTLLAAGNLAATLARMGKNAESEKLQRETLEASIRIIGPDHPDTINSMGNLATFLIDAGRLEEAEPLCRESLERRERVLGPNSQGTLVSYNVMSYLLRRQGKKAEGEVYLRKAFDVSKTALGEDHPDRLVLLLNMGIVARDQGRVEDEEKYFREALERSERTLGPQHTNAMTAVQSLSDLLVRSKRFEEAEALLARFEPIERKVQATADNGELRVLLLRLGLSRAAQGKRAEAEVNLLESHKLFMAARGPSGKGTLDCARGLSELYEAWNSVEPGAGHDKKAVEWREFLSKNASRPTSAPASQPATQSAPVGRRE